MNRARHGPKRTEHQGHADLTEARQFAYGKETAADLDHKEGRANFADIWHDKDKQDVFRNVGFHMHGPRFMDLFAKLQNQQAKPDEDHSLTPAQHDMQLKVVNEVNYRGALTKSCEKLLTPDVFRGVREDNHPVDLAIGKVGEQRALELIKPRLLKFASEPAGDETLQELQRALQQMNKIYATRKYQKTAARTESVMKRYDIKSGEYRDFTEGSLGQNISRIHGELSKNLGFFQRIRLAIPNLVHTARIAHAGWREDVSGAMRQLHEQRSQALDVISRVLDKDFFKALDKEAMRQGQADQILETKDAECRQMADGLTVANEERERNVAWDHDKAVLTWDVGGGVMKPYAGLDPDDREAAFDSWNGRQYTRDRKSELTSRGGGWFGRLLAALALIRLREAPKPSFA